MINKKAIFLLKITLLIYRKDIKLRKIFMGFGLHGVTHAVKDVFKKGTELLTGNKNFDLTNAKDYVAALDIKKRLTGQVQAVFGNKFDKELSLVNGLADTATDVALNYATGGTYSAAKGVAENLESSLSTNGSGQNATQGLTQFTDMVQDLNKAVQEGEVALAVQSNGANSSAQLQDFIPDDTEKTLDITEVTETGTQTDKLAANISTAASRVVAALFGTTDSNGTQNSATTQTSASSSGQDLAQAVETGETVLNIIELFA